MISGFDAPGMGGKGSYVDARGMHPPELADELARASGPHPIGGLPEAVDDMKHGRYDLALESVLQTVRAKGATTRYLLQNKPWDCAMILFGESDGAAHHFWRYADPNSPLFLDHPPGLRDSILRVYQELDRQTEELMALAPPGTTVLVMSDHGFGGVSNWIMYPNCWLRQQGFLRFRGGLARWRSRLLDFVKAQAVSHLPIRFKRMLFHLGKRSVSALEEGVRYGMIDWSGTQAYFEENPYYPVLWINLKGRQPKGTVEPGKPYEELRDHLIRLLEEWKHPQTGEPVVEKAFRREELYSGPCVEECPDIIVKWGLHKGYNYAFKLSSRSPGLVALEEVDPKSPASQHDFMGKSGHHRDDGIFLAQGPGIRAGATVAGARLVDLTPTILRLQGVPVPDYMDGRVLEEIFTAPLAEPEAPAGPALPVAAAAPADPGTYSADDEEKIAERLRALGYME
jgi:predicted AlkP superfamily phosphohydrolase/phosphomutase